MLAMPAGLVIGPLTWRPVFAGSILLSVGVNAVLFGVVAKLYAVARGILNEDRWVAAYRRLFRLEVVLALGAALFALGLALEVVLFGAWTSSAIAAQGLQIAALAQTLMIVGAEIALGGFLAMTIETR
jgi:hypothetical protein